MLLKRECSERLKVNKEIQELRKELASLALNVTIKDLRKMDSLKSVGDSNLEPTYFDDEDNDDSQEELSEGKSQKVNLANLVKLSLGKLLNHQRFL